MHDSRTHRYALCADSAVGVWHKRLLTLSAFSCEFPTFDSHMTRSLAIVADRLSVIRVAIRVAVATVAVLARPRL